MSIHTALKAGLVAVVLGAAALTVAPAQASPFGFGFGLTFGPSFGLYPMKPGITIHFGDPNFYKYCADDDQIEQGLRNKGWHHVQIGDSDNNHNRVWVTAMYQGDWYKMRVDRCTGKVDHVQQVDYNDNYDNNYNGNGNGITLHLF